MPPLVAPSKVGRIGEASTYSAATQRGVATHAPQHCSREATEPEANDATTAAEEAEAAGAAEAAEVPVAAVEASEAAEADAAEAAEAAGEKRAMAESRAYVHAPRGAAVTGRGGNGVCAVGCGASREAGNAAPVPAAAVLAAVVAALAAAAALVIDATANSSPEQCDSLARESQIVSYHLEKLLASAATSAGCDEARSNSSATSVSRS